MRSPVPTLKGDEPLASRDEPLEGGGDPPASSIRAAESGGWADFFGRYGLIVLLAGVAVLFSVFPESSSTFPTEANLDNLLANQTVIIITALALMLPLIGAQFDISAGAVVGLGSIATAAAMSEFHLPLGLAVAAGIGIGVLVGAINGALVAFGKLNSIIVTLAAIVIISGVVQLYTRGVTINTGISPTLNDFGSGTWLSIPQPALLVALVCVVIWYLLEHTPFGRQLHMVGGNPRAARLIGLPVDRLTFLSFVLAGGLAGLAGVILCARTGGANPQAGPGFLFPAFAAAFLGTTAIKPGTFNVGGTVIGVFFVAVTVSGLSLSGAEPWVQPMFEGAALLLAISLATVLARRGRNES